MGAPVGPGDVLAGKYRVERVLGEGGMGVVVAARHLQLDQIVALKFLLPEALGNSEALGRFLREARNAVRLKSEHVARIIDVGTLDTGAPYIVMEFLEGSDLASVLAQQRALAIPVAVDFLLQACDAIAEAHSLGIIHRDLKPQNLFVTRRHDGASLIKVLDFGISKSTAGGDFAATRTQAVMGSPAYMSPEQMRSAKLVDARTDVWALGIILYQLVLGRVPWEAETFTELCFKVAMEPLPPFPAMGLAPGFEPVVRRCLEKDPNQRFADVYELAVALLPFAPPQAQPLVEQIGRVLHGRAGERAAAPTIVAPGGGTLPEAAGQRVTRTATGSRRRGVVGLIAAIGVLAGILVTAIVLGRGGSSQIVDRTPSVPAEHAAAPTAGTAAAPSVAPPPPAAAQPSPSPAVTPPVPAGTPPTPSPQVARPEAPAATPPASVPSLQAAKAKPPAELPPGAQHAASATSPAGPQATPAAGAEPPAASAPASPPRDRTHRRPPGAAATAGTPASAPAKPAPTTPPLAPAKTAPAKAAPDPLSNPD